MRRSLPYALDDLPRMECLRSSAREELGQPQKLFNANQGAPGGDDHEGVDLGPVGPRGRQTEEPAVGLTAIEPVRAPGPALIEDVELATSQRVERVSHPESTLQPVHIRCSREPFLSAASDEAFAHRARRVGRTRRRRTWWIS